MLPPLPNSCRALSANTDGVVFAYAPEDEAAVLARISKWEEMTGFTLERERIWKILRRDINCYIQINIDEDGNKVVKTKGDYTHTPSLSKDPQHLIVQQAMVQWMLDGTPVRETIQAAADRRDLHQFIELVSADKQNMLMDGQPAEKVLRVYRSSNVDGAPKFETISKDGSRRTYKKQYDGCRLAMDLREWPNDLDIDWYVAKAEEEIARCSRNLLEPKPEPREKPKKKASRVEASGLAPSRKERGEPVIVHHNSDLPNKEADFDNDAFLAEIFGEQKDEAFVVSFTQIADGKGKEKPNWSGGPVKFAKNNYLNDQANNYYCISTMKPNADGVYKREQENFGQMHAFTMDDIMTKYPDPRAEGYGDPTAVIETSAGNFQYVYKLAQPITDYGIAKAFLRAMVGNKLDDNLKADDLTDVNRLMRLPVGINNKSIYPEPFAHQLTEWRPGVAYTVEQMLSWVGMTEDDLDSEAQQVSAKGVATMEEALAHPVIAAYKELGMLQSEKRNSRGWFPVRCFWHEEHSDPDDLTGTGVLIGTDGRWVPRCHHSHCAATHAVTYVCKETGEQKTIFPVIRGADAVREEFRQRGFSNIPFGSGKMPRALEYQFGNIDVEGVEIINEETGEITVEVPVDMGFSEHQSNFDHGGRVTGANTEESPEARRARQREEALRIGEYGTEDKVVPIPTAERLTLALAENRFAFITTGSKVVDLANIGQGYAFTDFKNLFKGSKVVMKNTTKEVTVMWLESARRKTFYSVTFNPGAGLSTVDPNDMPAVNLWQEAPLVEVDGWEEKSKLFIDHIRWLWGEHADKFLDWLAHIEQFPGQLPSTHWLHIATRQGMGRNTISNYLARVFAKRTALNFDLIAMLKGQFNERISGKLLVCVDELHETADTKTGAWEYQQKLKSITTMEQVEVNRKYGLKSVEYNKVRWLMFSNHMDAIPLSEDDRRLWVVSCHDEPRSPEYYTQLCAGLTNQETIHAIRMFFAKRDISGFNPYARPEMTETKATMIANSKGVVAEALGHIREKWPCDLITLSALEWLLRVELANNTNGYLDRKAQSSFDNYKGVAKHMNIFSLGKKKKLFLTDKERKIQAPVYALKNHHFWNRDSVTTGDIRIEFERVFGFNLDVLTENDKVQEIYEKGEI